jgi:hypothetical protein
MYSIRNRTTVDCTYLLACPYVEYNQKSASLNLRTAAGSRSRTPAVACSLNLQPGKDHTAADAANLNLQPNQDQADAVA